MLKLTAPFPWRHLWMSVLQDVASTTHYGGRNVVAGATTLPLTHSFILRRALPRPLCLLVPVCTEKNKSDVPEFSVWGEGGASDTVLVVYNVEYDTLYDINQPIFRANGCRISASANVGYNQSLI